jgi:exopolyphosphatase/guanosine-5'-triphosphate,3'-diphosphate pyrophosphatase
LPRYAAVDLGSNSALLLIAETDDRGELRSLLEIRQSVRLTKQIRPDGSLDQAAEELLVDALNKFAEQIERFRVDQVVAAATEIYRRAPNGKDIVERIAGRFDWPLEIITGETEAELCYLAAASGMQQVAEHRAVIDIGGGSTELISGFGDEVTYSVSMSVGAIALSERFRLAESVSTEELGSLDQALAREIEQGKLVSIPRAVWTIIVGGTATTLAAFRTEANEIDPERLHSVQLKRSWIEDQLRLLAALSLGERRERMSFDPDRAEIIVGGCALLAHLLRRLQLETVVVSSRGLRWGLLLRTLK